MQTSHQRSVRHGLASGSQLYKISAEHRSPAVYCVDPKLLLQPELWKEQQEATGRLPAVSLTVPISLRSELSKGHQELEEADTPGNTWYFGRKGELFDYNFKGSFPVISGFASIIHGKEMQAFIDGQHKPDAAWWTWEEFTKHYREDMMFPQDGHFPVLFAGRILEASSASVFSLGHGSDIQGLQISGDSEELD